MIGEVEINGPELTALYNAILHNDVCRCGECRLLQARCQPVWRIVGDYRFLKHTLFMRRNLGLWADDARRA